MALKKTVQLPTGITVENAYHRVLNIRIIDKNRFRFSVTSHVDAEKDAFTNQEFDAQYDLNGDNPFKQAYQHIKKMSEFADAVDC
jgi:hypothetical protein